MKKNQTENKYSDDSSRKNLPERKFRAGAISATVWKNTVEKEGTTFDFRTLSLERNYKDKQDEWQSTSTLRVNDIPKAVLVLNKAYEFLLLKEQDIQEESVEVKIE